MAGLHLTRCMPQYGGLNELAKQRNGLRRRIGNNAVATRRKLAKAKKIRPNGGRNVALTLDGKHWIQLTADYKCRALDALEHRQEVKDSPFSPGPIEPGGDCRVEHDAFDYLGVSLRSGVERESDLEPGSENFGACVTFDEPLPREVACPWAA